ncbi:hypothetical protein QUF80_14105 [Desulfococcaceae bacterium HSG8]|nr:hypothetical protein [Desulfococcaceae bacterium HSG8]
MDKSKKYIRLCERATEIQQQWVQGKGDWFVSEDGSLKCCVSGEYESAIIKNGFRITKNKAGIIRLSRYIWLPRLEQLMEIAQRRGITYGNSAHVFYDWTKIPYKEPYRLPEKIFLSVEQLWLAFVMQLKYYKKWDGKKWAKLSYSPDIA